MVVSLPKKTARRASQDPLPAETRVRLLDAAGRLFAQRGVEAVSIRDITAAAQVNLAAINYYFGGKDSLAVEVFQRLLEPLNERRLVLLGEVEKRAGSHPPKLEAIVEAMIRPSVEHGFASVHGIETFMQLLGRCMSETNPQVAAVITAQFEKAIQRFDAAFMKALPGLSHEELFWRITFSIGALHYALLTYAKKESFAIKLRNLRPQPNQEELIRYLVAFTSAGMRGTGA